MLGANPESALLFLLRACFVEADRLFKGPFSPYNLLCSSKLVIDHAFFRAVLAASKWIGPIVMTVGYLSTWPPADVEGLMATT